MQAFLLGHSIKRIAEGAGVFHWTVDGGHERFETMDDAAAWIRTQPRWRQECRKIHQPRCRGNRHARGRPARPAAVTHPRTRTLVHA